MEEVRALDPREDVAVSEELLGLLPVVVETEVGAVLLEVPAIPGEDRSEQLEDVEPESSGVDLLEDGRHRGLARLSVELDRWDVVGVRRLDDDLVEGPGRIAVGEVHEPRKRLGREQEAEREVAVRSLLLGRGYVEFDIAAEVRPEDAVRRE